MNNWKETPLFWEMQKNKVACSYFTKYKLHQRCLMSRFFEILIYRNFDVGTFPFFYLILYEFFSNSCVFPLMYFGFNFHTLWLQFFSHQKFSLLSYDTWIVSLNDDVKVCDKKVLRKNFSKIQKQPPAVVIQNRCS